MPGYPVCGFGAVSSCTATPGAALTDTPSMFPPASTVTPEPWAKCTGKFCPPRTTNAASGRSVMSNLSLYWPFSPGESSMAHLGETISYDTVFYQVPADLVAERCGSAAPGS